jgi:hypothetical protein
MLHRVGGAASSSDAGGEKDARSSETGDVINGGAGVEGDRRIITGYNKREYTRSREYHCERHFTFFIGAKNPNTVVIGYLSHDIKIIFLLT